MPINFSNFLVGKFEEYDSQQKLDDVRILLNVPINQGNDKADMTLYDKIRKIEQDLVPRPDRLATANFINRRITGNRFFRESKHLPISRAAYGNKNQTLKVLGGKKGRKHRTKRRRKHRTKRRRKHRTKRRTKHRTKRRRKHRTKRRTKRTKHRRKR